MKKIFNNSVMFLFVGLMIANAYIFLSGVALGDEINHYEKEITRLHQENLDIERKVYDVESLTYAASIAATMNFTKKTTPLYVDNLQYAFKP